MRLTLDPGHGGRDKANRGPTGYIEADGVLDIALRARDYALALGFEVGMTRDSDITLEPSRRAQLASSGDLSISIHTDAGPSTRRGCTVYVSAHNADSRKLGECIERELRQMGPSNGVRTRTKADGSDYYYMIGDVKQPAVLVECAFHSNSTDEALLKTEEFRQLLASSIISGVIEFVGVPIIYQGTQVAVGQRVDGKTRLDVEVRPFLQALGFVVDYKDGVITLRHHDAETLAKVKELVQ